MTAREEKQYAVTTVLVKFMADNPGAIGASEVAAAYKKRKAAVGAAST